MKVFDVKKVMDSCVLVFIHVFLAWQVIAHREAWSRGFAIESHKELLRVNEAHRRTQVLSPFAPDTPSDI